MFNRNSTWFGILLGIVMPLILYGILLLLWWLMHGISERIATFDISLFQLISPVVNLFLIRYYFVTKKMDETGRGVLLVTFIYVIAFFIINEVPGVVLRLTGN